MPPKLSKTYILLKQVRESIMTRAVVNIPTTVATPMMTTLAVSTDELNCFQELQLGLHTTSPLAESAKNPSEHCGEQVGNVLSLDSCVKVQVVYIIHNL